MDLPKIQTSNLFDQVYGMLKQSILRRDFRSNDKISIPALAKQMGISITPIREALNRLEAEGLVKTVPKVGTFVVGIDKYHVEQIIETRLMIDFWILDRFKQFTEERLKEIVKKLDKITQQALANIDPAVTGIEDYGNYDLMFHTEFIRAGENLKMLEIYLNSMTFRSLTIGKPTSEQYMLSMQQHRDIVKQLKKREWEEARTAIKRHLDYSKSNLIEWIEMNGGMI